MTRVAVLWNPDNPVWPLALKRLQAAAPMLGVTVQSLASLRATFSLDAVTLVPYEATGAVIDGPTVTMDGTFTITNINNACDCID